MEDLSKPSFFSHFRSFFSFDKHRGIERFGRSVVVFFVVLSIIIVFMTNSVANKHRDVFGSTVLFTHNALSGLTKQKVSVINAYRNNAGTRSLLLMKVPSDGPLSTNADGYRVFLSGVNQSGVQTELPVPISGGIFLYGRTGYMGVMLESPQKIPNTLVKVIVHSVSQESAASEKLAKSRGFTGLSGLDVWTVLINPGGSASPEIEALNSQKINPDEVFYDIFIKEKELAVKRQMSDELSKIQIAQRRYQDLRRSFSCAPGVSDCSPVTSLDGLTLMPPEVPSDISGDSVIGKAGSGRGEDIGNLLLQTSNILPGGFGFDWHKGNALEGYLSKIVPSGMSYAVFMDNLSKVPKPDLKTTTAWKLSNGTYLSDYSTMNGATSLEAIKPLIELSQSVDKLFDDILHHKYTYEVTLYQNLFKLEIALRSATQNVTVSTGQKAVTVLHARG